MPTIEYNAIESHIGALKKYDPKGVLGPKMEDLAFMWIALENELRPFGIDPFDKEKYRLIEVGAAQAQGYGKPGWVEKFGAVLRKNGTQPQGHIAHFFAAYQGQESGFPAEFYHGFDPQYNATSIDEKLGLADWALGPSVRHYPISRSKLRENLVNSALGSYQEVQAVAKQQLDQGKIPVIFSQHMLEKIDLPISAYRGNHMEPDDFQGLVSTVPYQTIPGVHIHLTKRRPFNDALKNINEQTRRRFSREFLSPVSGSKRDTENFEKSLQTLYNVGEVRPYRKVDSSVLDVSLIFSWYNGVASNTDAYNLRAAQKR